MGIGLRYLPLAGVQGNNVDFVRFHVVSQLGVPSASMTYPINVLPPTTLAMPVQNPSYLMFNGISTVLTVPNFIDVMSLDSFTIEMWFQGAPTTFGLSNVQSSGLGWSNSPAFLFRGVYLFYFPPDF